MATLPVLVSPTVEAIDEAYVLSNEERFPRRLGASILGRPCERQLWLGFRWVARGEHEGRMLRLLQNGHLEEQRMADDLRKAGLEVHQVDPSTGSQFEFEFAKGHGVCKIDGAVLGVKEAPKTWHVWEAKTHNDRSWNEVKTKGVEVAKPDHFSQCQIGMHKSGMKRALYEAKNKNDERLHMERLAHLPKFCDCLEAKAERAVFAPKPPPPITEDVESWQCRFCDNKDVCHGDAAPLRNCRTCMHSSPVPGGTWSCALAASVRAIVNKTKPTDYPDDFQPLSYEAQQAGCASFLYLPALVPGVLVEVQPLAACYRLKDGSTWWDGNKE